MAESLEHPCSPTELTSGIDTLYLSARGTVPSVLLDELELHKAAAQLAGAPVNTTLGGYPVRILGSGGGSTGSAPCTRSPGSA